MKEFIVYFEIFGKKMRTTVYALSETQAKEIIKSKIVFHKLQQTDEKEIDELLKNFKDFFGNK